MGRTHRITILVLTILTMTACATLQQDFETPAVNVSAIRPMPSDSLTPRFEIVLHIVNPNRSPLKLQGIVYTLALDGHKVLTGAANDLPTIEGYSEGEVTLTAATSLLSSIRFLTELMHKQRETIAFELTAKLDPGGIRPPIHVSEKGKIDFSAPPVN